MDELEKLEHDELKDDDLIDFDTLFKEEEKKKEPFDTSRVPFYLLSVATYIGRSFIAILVLVILLAIPALAPGYSLDEIVAREISLDVDGIGIVTDKIAEKYAHVATSIYSFKDTNDTDMHYIVNKHNQNLAASNQEDKLDATYIFEIEYGTTTTWSISKKDIKFYYNPENELSFTNESLKTIAVKQYEKLDEMNLTNVGFGLYQTFAMLITAAIVALLLRKEIVTDIGIFKDKNENKKLFSRVLICILYVLAAQMALNFIVSLINLLPIKVSESSLNQLLINLINNGPAIPLIILVSVILAPILEELVFRKAIFGLFKNKTVGLIVSSLAFGLIHVSSELIALDFLNAFVNSISYIGMGFTFGWLYLKNDRNIMIPIMAHAGYNLLANILNLLLGLALFI